MAMLSLRQGALPVRASPVRKVAIARTPLCIRAQAAATSAASSTTVVQNGNGYSTPVTVNFPEQIPGVLPAPQNYQNLVKVGQKKAQLTAANLFVSGILAGAYIAFGAFLMLTITGNMTNIAAQAPGLVKLIGGLIFPVGLTLVVLSGTELYTGNTAVIPMSIYEGQATVGGMLHNWFWSYFGNFVGSLMMVAAVASTGILNGLTTPVGLAEMKAGLPWATALIRSTLCNWLVCMAVWNAAAATTLTGKMAGLWGPISCFVAIGLEHSVANMFIIPMGISLGAKVTFSEFLWNNLLPVTLGNTLGGFLFVGTAFAFIHGSLGKSKPAPAAEAAAAN